MANMVARPQSLHDYLHDQLGWFELDAELRAMAERIIYNLDANGYLQDAARRHHRSRRAAAEQLALAEQALAVVQKLDPPGVGARDLRECLLLQLTPGMPLLRAAADADRAAIWKTWSTIGCRSSSARPATRSS